MTRKITNAYVEHFENEDLDLSGATILNCSFVNCRIKVSEPSFSYQSIFDHCTFDVLEDGVWRKIVAPEIASTWFRSAFSEVIPHSP
jgi:hypothetical protein